MGRWVRCHAWTSMYGAVMSTVTLALFVSDKAGWL